jgi:hypothetical protein
MELITPNDDFVLVHDYHLINGSPNIFSAPHFHHQIYTKLCRFGIKFEMRWSCERRRSGEDAWRQVVWRQTKARVCMFFALR